MASSILPRVTSLVVSLSVAPAGSFSNGNGGMFAGARCCLRRCRYRFLLCAVNSMWTWRTVNHVCNRNAWDRPPATGSAASGRARSERGPLRQNPGLPAAFHQGPSLIAVHWSAAASTRRHKTAYRTRRRLSACAWRRSCLTSNLQDPWRQFGPKLLLAPEQEQRKPLGRQR